MKVYVVCRDFPHHVFLSREKAEQYVKTFNTSPSKIDHYKIREFETVDEMMDNLKIVTKWLFKLEYPSQFFYINSIEYNNLDNKVQFTNGFSSDIKYEELKYHNSEKVRIRNLSAQFYVDKLESNLDYALIEEKIKPKANDLMLEIIQRRDKNKNSMEEVEFWLKKEPLAQIEKINKSLYD
ncbi:hypothetical protein [Paenibacillus taichungensis]|uniref:hypothetical protein n=1 Tax=Paenibacillus taichungensis TaxID=484184 RepID=UPI003D9A45BB